MQQNRDNVLRCGSSCGREPLIGAVRRTRYQTMNGVPQNLDLKPFHGTVLDYIIVARYLMALSFEPEAGHENVARLQIEGPWELLAEDGTVLDQGNFGSECINAHGPLRIHACVGRRVCGSTVDAPESISLQFEGGLSIRVFDTPGYHSFHIEPGAVSV